MQSNYTPQIPANISSAELLKLKSIYDQSPEIHKKELAAIERALKDKEPHPAINEIS